MNWELTVVTDGRLRPERGHLEICRAAIQGGCRLVQLRDKQLPDGQFYQVARAMKRELDAVGGLLIVNDRAAVAAALGTALHLGQDDLPIEAARALMPPGAIIGLTANTVQHALEAVRRGADYLGVSPIFEARTTKPDAGEPAGLTLLSQVRAAVNLPLVAIGGIKQGNAAQVIAAGADGLAVVSAVVDAADPSAATRWLLEEILSAKGHKP